MAIAAALTRIPWMGLGKETENLVGGIHHSRHHEEHEWERNTSIIRKPRGLIPTNG